MCFIIQGSAILVSHIVTSSQSMLLNAWVHLLSSPVPKVKGSGGLTCEKNIGGLNRTGNHRLSEGAAYHNHKVLGSSNVTN